VTPKLFLGCININILPRVYTLSNIYNQNNNILRTYTIYIYIYLIRTTQNISVISITIVIYKKIKIKIDVTDGKSSVMWKLTIFNTF